MTTIQIANIRLTSAERIVYPTVGLTKGDIAQYYVAIAPWMLPRASRRPLSVVRCPQGLHPREKCFFQKHAMRGLSDKVLRVTVPTLDGPDTQLAVDSVEGVLALVQFGALEFHVWGADDRSPDSPDAVVFDLDPAPDLKWARVVTAAFRIRKRLEQSGIRSLVKTTGGKGLHLVVPLTAGHSWELVRRLAVGLCERLERSAPTQFTTNVAKSARTGRILLDHKRNARGATWVAPYSTRAREGATVSTPVTWEELESLPRGVFHVRSVLQRLADLKVCPWSGYDQLKQTITEDQVREIERR